MKEPAPCFRFRHREPTTPMRALALQTAVRADSESAKPERTSDSQCSMLVSRRAVETLAAPSRASSGAGDASSRTREQVSSEFPAENVLSPSFFRRTWRMDRVKRTSHFQHLPSCDRRQRTGAGDRYLVIRRPVEIEQDTVRGKFAVQIPAVPPPTW